MASLLAADREDLDTIAALTQDSLLRACDTHYDAKRRTLTLLLNRFRWEEQEPRRGYCLLRLLGVEKAQRRSWPENRAAVLDLLHIDADDDLVELVFAGGTAIRCRVEAIDLLLEDVGAPWEVDGRPDHEDDPDPPETDDGEADDTPTA
ncbi:MULTISPECIES: DUF2948 family protein [Pacificimonas]|nr:MULTISPECIES: DUF2948 family protein [Pacificimonas]MBZ6377651.1 DUF2948 family protein [Pacificimonas aurantium]